MRQRISDEVAANVLIKSRRRCCFCYGLEKDHQTKLHGQIAHIDRDSGNIEESNLVYLCTEHHSIYDSTSQQCRNLTEQEARKYRDDLHEFNERHFDALEEQKIVFLVMSEEGEPVSFKAIRRHVYLVGCSDTRPAETQRQIDGLVNIGALTRLSSGEYEVNTKLIAELKKASH